MYITIKKRVYTNVINNGRKVFPRIVVTKASNRGLGIQYSVYSNVQYILVPICVLYSVQYSVQYSLDLRNNLYERVRVVFHTHKKYGAESFFMYGISFYVEYSEQYSEQCYGQFIVQYSEQCSGQYSTSK